MILDQSSARRSQLPDDFVHVKKFTNLDSMHKGHDNDESPLYKHFCSRSSSP